MDLLLQNSLTGKLEKFSHDKNVPIKWYTCGPTIYSDAHIGHARTFISFDVIRRVMMHFGYEIIYVMNITDIDDKIINKVKEIGDANTNSYYDFIKKMENSFWNDMDKLNNLRPTVVTRVTEYIDKIKNYIQKMEDNDLIYVINGTVYIDSEKYKAKGFKWDIFGRATTTEFTDCEFSSDKKNNADFSLWKAAKPGEITFDSKWGKGRPSWHIECSTMSKDILGSHIDIHSGGIDLIYPHHNNEIIQSISYENDEKIPIKYFLHSGHLNINGDKMAKSVGNFITIDNFLEKLGTSRQLRILFLLHSWNKPMDFTNDTLNDAVITEKRIIEFFSNMGHIIRKSKKENTSLNENDKEFTVYNVKMKSMITTHLLTNVDTKNVMKTILDIIGNTYKYVNNEHNVNLVENVINYVKQILGIFGIEFNDNNCGGKEEILIDMLVDFREDIRSTIKKNIKTIPKETTSDIFKILDDLRDNKLKPHGIIIEDMNKESKWKLL